MDDKTRALVVEEFKLMKKVCAGVCCKFLKGAGMSFMLAVAFGVAANVVEKKGKF